MKTYNWKFYIVTTAAVFCLVKNVCAGVMVLIGVPEPDGYLSLTLVIGAMSAVIGWVAATWIVRVNKEQARFRAFMIRSAVLWNEEHTAEKRFDLKELD
jgi:hypothetical protein